VSQLTRRIPFPDLPGIEPEWSRFIQVTDANGTERTFHYLDSQSDSAANPDLTVICVHGNPTWAYLWRKLLKLAPKNIRVVAVDQLGMGFSERIGQQRSLSERVSDLAGFVTALDIRTPIVSIAHDWGGPISLGWVEQVLRQDSHRIVGVVLLNTAVHQPESFNRPGLIRLARARGMLAPVTQLSNIFVRGTTLLSGKKISREVARAFAIPYGTREDRFSIRGFVADIPFEPSHQSLPSLDAIADSLSLLRETPVLLCWGPKDPVFSDQYLRDLICRMPQAAVHRYEGASHLVSEDAPQLFSDVLEWISGLKGIQGDEPPETKVGEVDLTLELRLRASKTPMDIALTSMRKSGAPQQVSWRTLDTRVQEFAAGMRKFGIKSGDRIAFLIPPGPELIALIYAAWSIGACIVLADSGLGVRGIIRALKGAHPDHVFAIPKVMPLVKLLQIPGVRMSTKDLAGFREINPAWGVTSHDGGLEGAVVFTSGSTGPAKGVRYSRNRIAKTISVLRDHYALTDSDVIIAAFAPWAVFGPAIGIASVLPVMNLSKPSSLTYDNLVSAINQAHGTLLWASPAALRNVLETVPTKRTPRSPSSDIRLILSAGAPVAPALLAKVSQLFPDADLRTPYGMTEALPLTDISITEILMSNDSDGVNVGTPIADVDIKIAPWNEPDRLSDQPHVMGEIAIKASHMRSSYDHLEFTNRRASAFPGWHLTGDVGHLDNQGNLWIEGRLAHVITAVAGPITPVPVEQRVEQLDAVYQAACVGVGPPGNQVVVLVVVLNHKVPELELIDSIRAVAGVSVSAVLTTKKLPTDIRHNAKIDREKLSHWATSVLSGCA
jgi:olefin beta-lactone synthetase